MCEGKLSVKSVVFFRLLLHSYWFSNTKTQAFSLTHCGVYPLAGWRARPPPAAPAAAPAAAETCSSSAPSHSPHVKRTRPHSTGSLYIEQHTRKSQQCHQRAGATRLIGGRAQLGRTADRVRAGGPQGEDRACRGLAAAHPPRPSRRARTDAARESYAQ